jgi:hypothetical protein
MNNEKGIKGLLIAILVALVLIIIFVISESFNIQSSLDNIANQISSINNTVVLDSDDDDEDNYNIECKVVKVDSEAPYKVEAEFTYSAVEFPSNAEVYFTIANKDSSVTKIDATQENGTFVGKGNIDLTEIDVDEWGYVFINDGKNVTKYDFYPDFVRGYREYSNSVTYYYSKTKNTAEFECEDAIDDNISWKNGYAGKVTNAYFEVSKGDEVVYTKELQIRSADDDSEYDYQLVIPNKITVGEEVDGFTDVYILLVDENGVEMKLGLGTVLDKTDSDYEVVNGTSLIFTKGDEGDEIVTLTTDEN